MRLGFVTCVQLGLSCMEAIHEVGGRLDLAISLPDEQAAKKSGRIYLDDFCASHGVPLVKSPNVNDRAVIESIQEHEIDWLFIVGWSQVARQAVLEAPTRGVLGMHPTLLPVGRGRAAIPWAILKGLNETGVTLFKLDGGVDTGDIVDQVPIPLTAHTDATMLYRVVEGAHIDLVRRAIPLLYGGSLTLSPQDESKATVWPRRTPEDGKINLDGEVAEAERLVRAVTHPYPGAYTIIEGRKLIVWRARMSTGREPDPGAFVLRFADGELECIETEDGGPI